jgi:heat shock protein HslJ
MMRSMHRAVTLTAILVLLTGGGAAAASPTPKASASVAPLVGQTWVLASYLGADGGYTGTDSPATIRFDTEVSGSTGCNDFQGPWSFDGKHLAIGPLTYTSRACTAANATQDVAIRASLGDIAGYQISDRADAELLDASGFIRLRYRTLEDRTWVPLYTGDEPTPAATVTVAFLDGIVSGQAPCNQFSAPYQLDGLSLSVGPIATTMMTCPDAALEQDFLAVLTAARSWTIDQGDLVLRDGDGVELRRFAQAPVGE